MPILFFLFVAVPILEIYLLIKVGNVIGAPWTVALVILTAVIGASLLRQQGLATLTRVQSTLAQGGLPAMELMEGALLLFGGALLLTPGFFTDTIGFACLIPPVRRWLIARLLERGVAHVQAGFGDGFHPHGEPGERPRGPHTIEGEWKREDDR